MGQTASTAATAPDVVYKDVQLAPDGGSDIVTLAQNLRDLQDNFNMCVESRSRTMRDYDLIQEEYEQRKNDLAARVEAGRAEYDAKLEQCAVAGEAAADAHRREVRAATAAYVDKLAKLQEASGDSDAHVTELNLQNAHLLKRLQAADAGLANAQAASRLEKAAAEEQHTTSRSQSRDTLAATKAACSANAGALRKQVADAEATALEQMTKTRACALQQVKLGDELQKCKNQETERTAEAVDDKTRDLQHALAVAQAVTMALVKALQAPTLAGPLRLGKVHEIMAIAAEGTGI
jgi:hypothetical protein